MQVGLGQDSLGQIRLTYIKIGQDRVGTLNALNDLLYSIKLLYHSININDLLLIIFYKPGQKFKEYGIGKDSILRITYFFINSPEHCVQLTVD